MNNSLSSSIKKSTTVLCVFFISIFLVHPVFSTEEYSDKTKQECHTCHIDPSGGNELTKTGEGYKLSLFNTPAEISSSKKTFNYFIKIIIGYIHFIFAFMWFGTILYVHLILKPAYAASGLPPAEVKLGIMSIIIMGITGMILTAYRVPSFAFLLSTKFGIILLIKIAVYTLMAGSAFYVVLIIAPKIKKQAIKKSEIRLDEITTDNLHFFDGQKGRPAYIAYKGQVYDVTTSKLWKEGNHVKRHSAGNDLTDIISQAPHSEEKILNMRHVAELIQAENKDPLLKYKKVFYFVAYMNLICVFVIILTLALWRWL